MKLSTFIEQHLQSNNHVYINNLGNKLLYSGYVKLIPYYLINAEIVYTIIRSNDVSTIYVTFNN